LGASGRWVVNHGTAVNSARHDPSSLASVSGSVVVGTKLRACRYLNPSPPTSPEEVLEARRERSRSTQHHASSMLHAETHGLPVPEKLT
jgi:hypothetical protein